MQWTATVEAPPASVGSTATWQNGANVHGVLRWLCVLTVVGVVSGFALLLLTGQYINDGPVVVAVSDRHGIHADDRAFGYRFIADELREQGITAGENRVARLRSQQRTRSVFAEKRGLNRKAGPPPSTPG